MDFDDIVLGRIYKHRDQVQEQYFSRQGMGQMVNPMVEISEQVYTNSPLDFGEILLQNLEMERRRNLQTPLSGNIRQVGGGQTGFRTKKQTFEWGSPNFVFKRESIEEPVQGKSGIQQMLEEVEISRRNSVDMEKYSKPTISKIVVTVFSPHRDPVKLEVTTDTTVFAVIQKALFHREKEDINVDLDTTQLNPRAYLLLLAQEDGSLDDDMPALGLNRQIGGFLKMSSYFALAKDPKFKELPEENQALSPIRLFKVHMHREEGADMQGFMSVVYQADMTLSMLRSTVFKKKFVKGREEDYGFAKMNDATNTPINLSLTLAQLGVMSLKLIYDSQRTQSFSNTNQHSRKESLEVKVQLVTSFTLEEAKKYAEYPAIQHNKYTRKDDVMLGIDGQKIYACKSKKGTRKPIGTIKEISKVHVVKPKYFHIELEQKTLKFESLFTDEIVAKLSTLLQNKNVNN